MRTLWSPFCKSQHSAGGICIAIWAAAALEVHGSDHLPINKWMQIPPAECWDLQITAQSSTKLETIQNQGRLPSTRFLLKDSIFHPGWYAFGAWPFEWSPIRSLLRLGSNQNDLGKKRLLIRQCPNGRGAPS